MCVCVCIYTYLHKYIYILTYICIGNAQSRAMFPHGRGGGEESHGGGALDA
jgi:hypothetical protein